MRRPLENCEVFVLGWNDAQHHAKAALLDLETVALDALSAWNYGFDEYDVADVLIEAHSLIDASVEIEDGVVVVRIDVTN